jgi:hypothetical protein
MIVPPQKERDRNANQYRKRGTWRFKTTILALLEMVSADKVKDLVIEATIPVIGGSSEARSYRGSRPSGRRRDEAI